MDDCYNVPVENHGIYPAFYVENNQKLKDGDLLLIDAGCELDFYAADITRTFPVNGKFSKEQKAIYEIVLNAQFAAFEKIPRSFLHQ